MMRIDFETSVEADRSTVYGYFQTPYDWTRLYGSFGDTVDRGDGWVAIPLRGFPFPLIARITDTREPEFVAWELRGFFAGHGEVRLRSSGRGTEIKGYEAVGIPSLLGLGRLVERHYLEPRFRSLWAGGWRRLGAGWEHDTGIPKRTGDLIRPSD